MYWISCDLLSKICIFDILNNRRVRDLHKRMLWFAFKNLYLWYSEQHDIVNSLFYTELWGMLENKKLLFGIKKSRSHGGIFYTKTIPIVDKV